MLLQLDLRTLDNFLGMAKSREHGIQEQGKSSDATEIRTQDLESKLVPSTS